MSYKIEIMDEYSFGHWFSPDQERFATEAEATECSHHFGGWRYGILDLRVVPSNDAVNARWTEKGVTDKDGNPTYTPPPPASPEEIRASAEKLSAAWEAIVERMDASLKRRQEKD
jgi:hypothetical protein